MKVFKSKDYVLSLLRSSKLECITDDFGRECFMFKMDIPWLNLVTDVRFYVFGDESSAIVVCYHLPCDGQWENVDGCCEVLNDGEWDDLVRTFMGGVFHV